MELTNILVPELKNIVVDNNFVTASLLIPENLFYFSGHFPGMPIVPGVVLLHWAVQFAATTINISNKIAKIQSLKFTNPLQPKLPVQLNFEYDPSKHSLKFVYAHQKTRYASGTVIYREDYSEV